MHELIVPDQPKEINFFSNLFKIFLTSRSEAIKSTNFGSLIDTLSLPFDDCAIKHFNHQSSDFFECKSYEYIEYFQDVKQ